MSSVEQTPQALIRYFDDDRLKSKDVLSQTLSMLTMVSESSYEAFFKQLLSPPSYISQPTLELVLACMSASCPSLWLFYFSTASECGDELGKWLREIFVPSPKDYSASLHALILERLSLFFQFAYYPSSRDIFIALASYRAKVQAAPRAIEALLRFSPRPSIEPEGSESHSLDGIFAIGSVKMKQSQRKRKQAKSHAGPPFDPAVLELFQTLGITPPESVVDASTKIAEVIAEQLDILKVLAFHIFLEFETNIFPVLP